MDEKLKEVFSANPLTLSKSKIWFVVLYRQQYSPHRNILEKQEIKKCWNKQYVIRETLSQR